MYLESILRSYRLSPVPQNPALREKLKDCSMQELTDILSKYKTLHNTTDVDSVQRAIRAIEIADYYAHSNKQVQKLMEDSALVIIDLDDAIANGYVRLSKNIEKIMRETGRLAGTSLGVGEE